MSRPDHLPALKRVGHKGADHVAPGNTRESFEAALEHGVDMIEFDVLRLPDRRLVLAHDHEDAAARDPLSLEDGLDILAGASYVDVELDVDLKLPGYEREVIEALRGRGLDGRSLVSSTYLSSLEAVARLSSGMRRAWSVPRARRDYTKTALAVPAYGLLLWWRARLPAQARTNIARGLCHAVMAHRLLATPRLVDAVHGAGGQLYVWTVDDAERIARFEALGVDGVITNDPRLFDDRRWP